MADDQYDDDQYDDQEDGGQKPDRTNAEWAALRKERKERSLAEQRAQAAERQLAFIQAGVDPADPRASYFVKGYDGELTAEAIKAAALAGGFIAEQGQGPADDGARDALAASQRIAQAAAGGAMDVPASTELLDRAYVEGGSEAVLAEAERVGITVVRGQ